MKLAISVSLVFLHFIIIGQTKVDSLKYYVPENVVIHSYQVGEEFLHIQYWKDSNSINDISQTPIGLDVFHENGQLLLFERFEDSLGFAIHYQLDGTISLIKIYTDTETTMIYYHRNGIVSYIGTFDLELDDSENNETGAHFEFNEEGDLISYKLFDKGVLLRFASFK